MLMYYANFVAGHSVSNMHPYEGTNLKNLIRDIREIAEGNTPRGGECRWYIEDENGLFVATGGLKKGRRFRGL